MLVRDLNEPPIPDEFLRQCEKCYKHKHEDHVLVISDTQTVCKSCFDPCYFCEEHLEDLIRVDQKRFHPKCWVEYFQEREDQLNQEV